MTGKILVVDPVATNRIVLKAKLSAAFYDAESVATADQALAAAHKDPPDLILLADRVAPGGTAALCAALRNAQATADVPVLVLSDRATGAERASCLLAGADDLVDRTAGDAAILSRIRAMLSDAAARSDLSDRLAPSVYQAAARIEWGRDRPGTIGWVSAQRSRALGYQARLAATGAARATLLDPATVLGRAPSAPSPDLYVVEEDLGRHGSGLELLSDLAARPHSRSAMVLVLAQDTDALAAAFDLGAGGVCVGPVDAEEIAARLTAILRRKRQKDRLRDALDQGLALAVEDPLTRLQNRRSTMEGLGAIAAAGQTAALFMIDIDHFKSVNDRLGHAAGDAVLVAVSRQLRQSLAQAKVLGRVGGEEFLAAVTDLDAGGAVLCAEALRRDVSELHIPLPDGIIGVTISLGATLWTPEEPLDVALGRADHALYSAKDSGRNCVRHFDAQHA